MWKIKIFKTRCDSQYQLTLRFLQQFDSALSRTALSRILFMIVIIFIILRHVAICKKTCNLIVDFFIK